MKVEFAPLGLTVTALKDESVLDAARRGSVPLGNSCGAVGVCGRCLVTILRGDLSSATSSEERYAARRPMLPSERLACQAVVKGDCRVTTPYW